MAIYEKYDDDVVWILLQYLSPSGNASIDEWRKNLTTAARKADMDVFLRNIAKKSKWSYPEIGGFSGKHLKGFRELRWKSDGVPHRIGGYFAADNEFVMLLGFTHNSKKYDPPSALDMLITRHKKVKAKEATLCEYSVITGRRT